MKIARRLLADCAKDYAGAHRMSPTLVATLFLAALVTTGCATYHGNGLYTGQGGSERGCIDALRKEAGPIIIITHVQCPLLDLTCQCTGHLP